jgi:outer membrane protein assembly factor BamB
MSITGVLSAWDAETGESLWRRDYASRFKKSTPYWGASTSPIVDGEGVVVHFGGDDEGVLVALDVESGDEIWSQGKDGASYSSPLVAELNGVRQIVEWNHNRLVGVESGSGRLLWEYPFPHVETNQNMPTPTLHNGRVLVGGENRGIRSVEPQLNNGVWTVKERWFQEQVALDMSSAVVNGDLLYGFSHYDSGRIFCLDTETGEVLWQGPPRTGQNVTFLSIPGHVVALIDDGELRVIKASGDRYEQVASYRVAESPSWAPPVVMQSGILVKDKESLTMWSLIH